jgi:hypothetical protein
MIFEYSIILYSDFDMQVIMHITLFIYDHHHSVHTTLTTLYFKTLYSMHCIGVHSDRAGNILFKVSG